MLARINILCVVALLCVALPLAVSQCGYSFNQVWDVARTADTCTTVGGICSVFQFDTPFISPYNFWVKVNPEPGQYYVFFDTTDSSNPLGVSLYNADGTFSKTVSASGKVTAIGDKGFLYVGKLPVSQGGTGYFITLSDNVPVPRSDYLNFTINSINPAPADVAREIAQFQWWVL
jgi:hypothetical protein